ncbi:MAG: cysteine--tRNA ligase [Armatimonadetes bacterium]|nr:cysteine--tRNA ligase [Armatimonadota bacterium]MDW8120786.1 cysteine--tRNA ligase [Armatimonadota bacterium]
MKQKNFTIRLYNTLTKRKEPLHPRTEKVLHMYVCGLTPYDSMHIGHARTFTIFDAFRRFLEHLGWTVIHVQNWTDIDDKIIQRANEKGCSSSELAEDYIAEAMTDWQNLGLCPPHIMPRVTDHIPEIIQSIGELINGGYAYQADGDVYFSVARYQNEFGDYGDLSGQNLEEIQAGARVEPGEHKRNPIDFALWKRAKEGEPFWDSPWGRGRPGWHIECSVMSLKYLGHPIDLHGAAVELTFPHHENEKAQSQALVRVQPVVRHWMHCGVLNVAGDKMSKSLGNIIPLSEALKKSGPNDLRLLFLSTHYRSPLNYTDDLMAGARASVRRLSEALTQVLQVPSQPTKEEDTTSSKKSISLFQLGHQSTDLFYQALADDFNTAEALGYVFRMVGGILTTLALEREGLSPRQKEALLFLFGKIKSCLTVLGFDVDQMVTPPVIQDEMAQDLMTLLIELRQKLRAEKLFSLADWIRSSLGEKGIILEDGPEGTRWRRK